MDYEDILMALKNGNIPPKGTLDLAMERDKEIQEFEKILSQIESGKAVVKFINGQFGAGKSFFLKVIEEMAYKNNFAVSWITLSNEIPFNKFDVVYRNIAQNLKVKTGEGLTHIMNRWIAGIKMKAIDEDDDPINQNKLIVENIQEDLKNVRIHSNSIATAIEHYYKFSNSSDNEMASHVQAWLRGDSKIPFTVKREFGVKGDVDKESAMKFLEALSVFIKSAGYSGLVVLLDEAEFIMKLHTKKLRDIAYNYMRDLYDECSKGNFKNSLFVFAGTPQFFEDSKKGIRSYQALENRITKVIKSKAKDLRTPIIELEGFNKKETLMEIATKLMVMHEEVYKWNASDKFTPIIENIATKHEENTELTEGKVIPRTFMKSFISALDTVEQNQELFESKEPILELFDDKDNESSDDFDDEDW
ncbi:MAG: ATP-binding protein [Methanobrevibacter sp.]|jgi:hypothetical protein|nr:ATP-binding protein [Candidatus Methanovirga australis]